MRVLCGDSTAVGGARSQSTATVARRAAVFGLNGDRALGRGGAGDGLSTPVVRLSAGARRFWYGAFRGEGDLRCINQDRTGLTMWLWDQA
eukprot:m.149091 g.149091  ORF g.149091 m.149091 type:complete len:90 (-) comp17803_c2_seq2:24-293(-)